MAKTLLELAEGGLNACQVCKRWCDCPYGEGKEWYTYPEIRYCRYQVIWIIEQADTLSAGDWPLNPDGSTWIDPGIVTGYANEAYYTKPIGIIADVKQRLSRTGVHGKLLRAEIWAGFELSYESQLALKYVSGWRPKTMSYSHWKKQRKQRKQRKHRNG